MFHIALTFEDQRIVAASKDGKAYNTVISDAATGESIRCNLTPLQLSYIFAINMDNDGTPEGVDKMYELLEPLFVGWPPELRPIP